MTRPTKGSKDGKRTEHGGSQRRGGDHDNGTPTNGSTPEHSAPGMTGRYLVLLREDVVESGASMLSNVAGLSIARTSDFEEEAFHVEGLGDSEGMLFENLGVAVVNAVPDQIRSLGIAAAGEDNSILAIEPEQYMYAVEEWPVEFEAVPQPPIIAGEINPATGLPLEYLYGYGDAVNHLLAKLTGSNGASGTIADAVRAAAFNESTLTWGLQITKAGRSRYSGKGIRVAVLDTGLDLGHPDFGRRRITSRSFIAGQSVQDGHGHGTHCIGTSCGPCQPGRPPRYGIAWNAEIFVGKVLSNQGSGADGGILAGIDWAVQNRCHVVSMSLGAPVLPGQSYSPIYEAAASRALRGGTLIVAAASNDSARPGVVRPVGRPANCPSIMAVGALDSSLGIAPFSNGGINGSGGNVDIVGPGVNIHSSWPRPISYNRISGTSMATPHVAGIAALLAEANPSARGEALWNLLIRYARRLALPTRDVGAGLVQAP